MKSVRTNAHGSIDVVDLERPTPGPNDVFVRACGIYGTDVSFLHLDGRGGPLDGAP
jgi:threonine dehydrogenase-like Zn-dependent dehydrogenase